MKLQAQKRILKLIILAIIIGVGILVWFTSCCVWHDIDYSIHHWKTEDVDSPYFVKVEYTQDSTKLDKCKDIY